MFMVQPSAVLRVPVRSDWPCRYRVLENSRVYVSYSFQRETVTMGTDRYPTGSRVSEYGIKFTAYFSKHPKNAENSRFLF